MSEEPAEAAEERVPDPLTAIQEAISGFADDSSLCASFAVVVEWLEMDGSTTMSVIHSPMPPWHLFGLLSYARDDSRSPMLPILMVEGDDDDEDF